MCTSNTVQETIRSMAVSLVPGSYLTDRTRSVRGLSANRRRTAADMVRSRFTSDGHGPMDSAVRGARSAGYPSDRVRQM
jgi:hypothetical protein